MLWQRRGCMFARQTALNPDEVTPWSDKLTMQPHLKQGLNRPQDSGEVTVHNSFLNASSQASALFVSLSGSSLWWQSWLSNSQCTRAEAYSAMLGCQRPPNTSTENCLHVSLPFFFSPWLLPYLPHAVYKIVGWVCNPLSPFFPICPPLSLLPSCYYLWSL